MTRDIQARVVKVVVEQGELKREPGLDAHLRDDLGFDSLALVELTLALESSFGVEIPDGDAMTLQRVRDVVAYLEPRVK